MELKDIQVGQRLKLNRKTEGQRRFQIGEIVTVSAVANDYVYVDGAASNSGCGINAGAFDPVADEVDGFKVGDVVEVIYGGAGISSVDIGKRATIVAVDADATYYRKITVDGKDFRHENYSDKHRIPAASKSFKKVVVSTIDFTAPLETLGGRAFTLLSMNGRGDHPVVGYLDDSLSPVTYAADGSYTKGQKHLSMDLRNVAEKPLTLETTVYKNVYKGPSGLIALGSYATREEADEACNHDRVGVTKVVTTMAEGEYAD